MPEELIDENLRTDVGWLLQFNLSLEHSKEMQDLGITTLQNAYRMTFPNQTMRSIYMDYYKV